MRNVWAVAAFGVLMSAVVLGCATTVENAGLALKESAQPAWSLRASQSEISVSVSPARQTLQILGSSGILLGASISAVANDRYRQQLEPVLKDYDPGAVFEKRLADRLDEVVGDKLSRVAPQGATAGFNNARDAEKARFATLNKKGIDRLLDLQMTYGVFGVEGLLIAELEGKLVELPKGHATWRNDVIVSASPILASDALGDPTDLLKSNLSSPRLSGKEDAIGQWTKDGGVAFRAGFEAAVDGAVSAILTDLGLVNESSGYYYLGRQAMLGKEFDSAEVCFQNALKLDPNSADAKNGLAVTLARKKKVDDAIALAKEIVAASPDFAPANYNLAWWYAVEKRDAVSAKPYYEKAVALGMANHKKIDKILAH